jgi:hypothetical protein
MAVEGLGAILWYNQQKIFILRLVFLMMKRRGRVIRKKTFLRSFLGNIPIFLLLFSFPPPVSVRAGERTIEATLAHRAGSPASIGLGLGIGDPTGIDFVWMIRQNQWLHLEAGTGDRAFVFYGDYHFSLIRAFFREADLSMPFSVGVGGILGAGGEGPFGKDSTPMFGIRVPLNTELWFHTIPLAIFLELAPQVTTILPRGFFSFQLGIRFYLGGGK